MTIVIDPLTGAPLYAGPSGGTGFAPADDLSGIRGLEATFGYNGLLLHDRSTPDRFWINEVDGFADSDLRDAREDNPDEDGETPLPAFYGGRTITFAGKIQTGNISKIRQMQHQLRTALVDLVESPLEINYWNIYEPFNDANALKNFFFDLGAGTYAISNGTLVPTDTTSKLIWYAPYFHSNGYLDYEAILKINIGATNALGTWSIASKRIDANNHLLFKLNGSGSTLLIQRVAGGVQQTITGGLFSISPALAVSNDYYLLARQIGNDLTIQLWDGYPSFYGTPHTTGSLTLTTTDITTYGAAVSGFVGVRSTPNNTDHSFDDFTVAAINPTDIYAMVRKSAPIAMKEQQVDGRYQREFLVTFRASDPRVFSAYTDRYTIIPTSVARLGRVYPRTYPLRYSTYLDTVFAPTVNTQTVTVKNRGNYKSSPVFRLYGNLNNPVVLNSTTGKQFKIEGTIQTGDYYEYVTGKTPTLKDSSGSSRFSTLSEDSDNIECAPGDNVFTLSTSSFDSSSKLLILNQSAWK